MTVVPHNTWKELTTPSLISLSLNSHGVVQPTGSLKILDFILHPQIGLIFKLEYRVQITEKSGHQRHQDFVIAYGLQVPQLCDKNTDLLD